MFDKKEKGVTREEFEVLDKRIGELNKKICEISLEIKQLCSLEVQMENLVKNYRRLDKEIYEISLEKTNLFVKTVNVLEQ